MYTNVTREGFSQVYAPVIEVTTVSNFLIWIRKNADLSYPKLWGTNKNCPIDRDSALLIDVISFFKLAFNRWPGRSLVSQVTTTGELSVGRVSLITEKKKSKFNESDKITRKRKNEGRKRTLIMVKLINYCTNRNIQIYPLLIQGVLFCL